MRKLIKRIKDHREYKKTRKYLEIEMAETLCSICLYLETEGRRNHNQYSQNMFSHFSALKTMSKHLRDIL